MRKILIIVDDNSFMISSKKINREAQIMTAVHLQVVWEAIVDAGYNPENLRGSKTAVWVACNRSETGEALCGKDGELS